MAARPRFLLGGIVAALLAAATVASAQPSGAPVYYFTTLAGTSSTGTTDGVGTAARFNQPRRVAVDRAGNLYVADTENCAIRKITPAGVVSTLAGTAGLPGSVDGQGATARFGKLQGIVVDSTGNLFVVDGDNDTIRKITPTGVVSTLAGTAGSDGSTDGTGSAARFSWLRGITIDAADNLYVVDKQSLRKITSGGVVTTVAPLQDFVEDVVADNRGNFFVTFYAGIVKIAADGTSTVFAGRRTNSGTDQGSVDGPGSMARFANPSGLAIDRNGNLFVADTGNCTIRQITADAVVTTVAGSAGSPGDADGVGFAARFGYPTGLSVDEGGNVAVADTSNNTIRKIAPGGVVATLAGLSQSKSVGSTDGVGAAARFGNPAGIAVTTAGICYVSDYDNHIIRKVALDGTVTTFAGAVGQTGIVDGTGNAARFNGPSSLALDASGNLYAVDGTVVRKITPAGVVTTFAGNPNPAPGSLPTDGIGTAAQFAALSGIAVAPDGNIWVAETKYYSPTGGYLWWARLRKITPAGVVTAEKPMSLLAYPHTFWTGLSFDPAGTIYACDSTYYALAVASLGAEQRMAFQNFSPWASAARSSTQVFLCESGNTGGSRVAWSNAAGQMEIIGGRAWTFGHRDGVGTDAIFTDIAGIAIDGQGSLYLATSDNTIRKGVLATAPTIVTQPQSTSVAAGSSAQFSVSAAGVPAPTYQWKFKGAAIVGATAASYSVSSAQAIDAGDYSVTVTNELGNVTSNSAQLTVTAAPPTGGGGGSGGSGGGGGGGAPSTWFLVSLAGLGGLRLLRRLSRG